MLMVKWVGLQLCISNQQTKCRTLKYQTYKDSLLARVRYTESYYQLKFVIQSKICDTKKTEVHKHRTRLLSSWHGVYRIPTEAIIITNICLMVKYLVWITGKKRVLFVLLKDSLSSIFCCNTKTCKAFHFLFKDFLSLFYWKIIFHP